MVLLSLSAEPPRRSLSQPMQYFQLWALTQVASADCSPSARGYHSCKSRWQSQAQRVHCACSGSPCRSPDRHLRLTHIVVAEVRDGEMIIQHSFWQPCRQGDEVGIMAPRFAWQCCKRFQRPEVYNSEVEEMAIISFPSRQGGPHLTLSHIGGAQPLQSVMHEERFKFSQAIQLVATEQMLLHLRFFKFKTDCHGSQPEHNLIGCGHVFWHRALSGIGMRLAELTSPPLTHSFDVKRPLHQDT